MHDTIIGAGIERADSHLLKIVSQLELFTTGNEQNLNLQLLNSQISNLQLLNETTKNGILMDEYLVELLATNNQLVSTTNELLRELTEAVGGLTGGNTTIVNGASGKSCRGNSDCENGELCRGYIAATAGSCQGTYEEITGSCNGSSTLCANRDQHSCILYSNCSWVPSKITKSCSGLTSSQCTSHSTSTISGVCNGSSTLCANRDQHSCILYSNCSWVPFTVSQFCSRTTGTAEVIGTCG
ncbi:MAG: hypothetical protein LBG59_01525 [Candidatus Peribacteria bacterium]|jgi:hypothetical protein|nr:hypothetical protein [Candidatus Peribacteria bacterium]